MVKNVFNKDFCDQLILNLQKNEWKTHFWYGKNSYGGKKVIIDNSDFAVVYNQELQDLMIPYIRQFLLEYISKINNENPCLYGCSGYEDNEPHYFINEYSKIRFNRYDEGKTIKKHIDHIHDLFDGTKKGIPVLSLVGVFNDDYKGGEFIMWDDTLIPLKCGDIVCFPSLFMYQHQVKPIISGSRYSWVQWIF